MSDAKQTASDGQQIGDAQQTKSDAQSAVQDVQQNAQDVAQTAKDLKGIGSLALKALDGTMDCTQNNGSACNDTQTKALQNPRRTEDASLGCEAPSRSAQQLSIRTRSNGFFEIHCG